MYSNILTTDDRKNLMRFNHNFWANILYREREEWQTTMDALKKLSELHDYIKKNYERGTYDNSNNQDYVYHEVNENQSASGDDYQMGFDQALKDHEEHRFFKSYPEKLVNIGNQVSENKMQELSEFIAGYNAGKKRFK